MEKYNTDYVFLKNSSQDFSKFDKNDKLRGLRNSMRSKYYKQIKLYQEKPNEVVYNQW